MGNTASSVRYGASSSLTNATLICQVFEPFSPPGPYQSETSFAVSATAPLSGGSGQQVYFTDVNGEINLGFAITGLGVGLSLTHYKVNYTITFDKTDESNARARSQTSFVHAGSAFGPLSNPYIKVPSAEGVLDPFGPVTLGASGTVTDFRLANLTLDVQYSNQLGETGGPVYRSICGESQLFGENYPRFIIASTYVDNTTATSTPLAPANSVPGTFPPTVRGEKSVNANLPVTCKNLYNELSTSNVYNLSFTGTGRSIYFSNDVFNLTNVQTVFSIPPDAVTRNAEAGVYGYGFTLGKGQNGVDLPGPGLELDLENVGPSSWDTARNFSASALGTSNPLSTGRYVDNGPGFNETVTFPLPFVGDLTLGNLTAGQFPRVPTVSIRSIQGNVFVYYVDGERGIGDFGISCQVAPNSLLRSAIYV